MAGIEEKRGKPRNNGLEELADQALDEFFHNERSKNHSEPLVEINTSRYDPRILALVIFKLDREGWTLYAVCDHRMVFVRRSGRSQH